jgi:arylsulfatase A-like enzyme
MLHRRFIGLVVSLIFAGLTGEAPCAPPNVIIVFADDQGYRDLGCFGSPDISTPNIDRLAEQGMRFTSFYSAYCVCSASRASLMTGCYQPRLNMPGVLGPRSDVGLHPDEVTIAELLKGQGYATMCIGKWHLGDKPQTLPTAQGFDHYFGIPYSNDMARREGWGNGPDDLDKIWKQKKWDVYDNELLRDEEIIEKPVNQTTLTHRYTEEAVKFVRAHAGGPFFLYFPHSMPHVPLFVSDDRYDADPHRAYKLAIEHIDWSVGQVTQALDELGIAENTLIVYSSDNGPWLQKLHHAGSALPLRAGKARVPGLMRWPARIPAGTVCDEVVSSIDLLPTIASLVGAELPPHPIDGLDISALLENPSSPSPHRTAGFFYYVRDEVEAVRLGKWKLRMQLPPPRSTTPTGERPIELYDLETDISEQHNLADAHPEIVAKLQELAKDYDADLKANSRPLWRADGL